jgi:colanic acid biosynthesis glycosyl transferase WcaI
LRILVHEFGGYPFPVELSRELAARGYEVTHSWCASLIDTAGSAAELARREDNPAMLDFVPLDLGEPLDKYRYLKRFRQERRYGSLAAELTERVGPEVVLAADVPLDGQRILLTACRRLEIPFVFWLQDLIGIGTHHLLGARIPLLGRAIGRHYMRLEARLLRESAAVVPITDDFRPFLDRSGVDAGRVTTIENWAPLGELPVRPKDNPWARAAGLSEDFVFAYTGAIGMKQDRELVLQLALRHRERTDVRVLVLSGGPELDYLRERARELGLRNLILRGFVPWDEVPDVLGSADVLIASIHRDAGRYSVPSKVLSYLCAGRALLVSVPAENLAGRLVAREEAGVVAEPGDVDSFFSAASRLLDLPEERARMGANARRYAESAFAIGPIADRFEGVLERAMATRPARSAA